MEIAKLLRQRSIPTFTGKVVNNFTRLIALGVVGWGSNTLTITKLLNPLGGPKMRKLPDPV